jgi:ATP-dependent protease HslVU (ClpYQ) peptidase subunit
MTCIVAVSDGEHVYMAGDSAAVDEHNNFVTIRREPKVFSNGQFLLGFSGSFRFGRAMEYYWTPPDRDIDDLNTYMNIRVTESIREMCDEYRIDITSEGDNSELLLGIDGHIFEMCNDWHIGENLHTYNAIGSGSDYALGSLWTTSGQVMSPFDRLTLALEAAAEFSTSVRPPFIFIGE